MAVRAPHRDEWTGLLRWLDDGLRKGRRGRLRAEYPTALATPDLAAHRLALQAGRFASHTCARVVEASAAGRSIPLGMIGLVYTDPAFRGRGLAGACVRASLAALRERGVPLAALWSDRHAFYARLGFEPAGREWSLEVTPELCERALRCAGGGRATGEPREEEWPQLEALYARKPARALRPAGALARLAACPDCRVVVARRGGRVGAYAALGRGDDFDGVVHEWGGDAAGVAACLATLVEGRDSLRVLASAASEPAAVLLRRCGAPVYAGCFALLRLLDAPALWQRLAEGDARLSAARLEARGEGFALKRGRRELGLGHADALRLLLGPSPPTAALELLGGAVEPLPWPLFVWGFDSL